MYLSTNFLAFPTFDVLRFFASSEIFSWNTEAAASLKLATFSFSSRTLSQSWNTVWLLESGASPVSFPTAIFEAIFLEPCTADSLRRPSA